MVQCSAVLEKHFEALRNDDPRRTRLHQMIRDCLLTPRASVSKDTFLIVGHEAPAWISANAAEVVAAHPRLWHAILSCLLPAGEDRLVEAGRTIIETELIPQEEMGAWLSTHFPHYEWSKELLKILAHRQEAS